MLTYDDGPSAEVSPRVADLLGDRGALATFFVIGRNADRHPELIARLQRDGHEIGSHTRDHRNAWKTSPWAAVRDIQAGRRDIEGLGVRSRSFRPPFGKSTPATLLLTLLSQLRMAYWTVDTRDSWARRPVEEVLEMLDRQGGGVVLMHDFTAPLRGPQPQAHADYLLNLTETLIDFAKRRGFTLLRFQDLFDDPSPVRAGAAE